MSKFIPRSLAYDMLFGSNKIDGHKALDLIYDGLDTSSQTCENCKHLGQELPGKHNKDHWRCNEQIGYDSCAYSDEPYVILTFGCNFWEIGG